MDSIYKRILMSSIQIACAVLVSLFWGMQFVVIKVGLTAFPPLFFRGSSILRRRSDFAAVRRVIKPTRTRFDAHHLGLPGRAELRTDLYRTGPRSCRHAGGCSAVVTPFTMLLAWSFLGERPSPRVILGLVVAFGGVALSSAGSDASVRQLAILLIISGGLAMAIRNVLTERHGPYEPLNLLGGCRRCWRSRPP